MPDGILIINDPKNYNNNAVESGLFCLTIVDQLLDLITTNKEIK